MRKLAALLILVFLSSFTHYTVSPPKKIRWKKVKTVEQARSGMDSLIKPGSHYSIDLMLLQHQRHSYIAGEGDSVIYFHSKEVPVHFLSFVVRKWMYTFHFVNKKMTSYEVKEGLTGP